jgi:hypothetical protein
MFSLLSKDVKIFAEFETVSKDDPDQSKKWKIEIPLKNMTSYKRFVSLTHKGMADILKRGNENEPPNASEIDIYYVYNGKEISTGTDLNKIIKTLPKGSQEFVFAVKIGKIVKP